MRKFILDEALEKYDDIRNAMNILLADDPDMASVINGVGFNKFDGNFARNLMKYYVWSPKQANAAYNMLAKYRKQLSSAGVDYSLLQKPEIDVAPVESAKAPSSSPIGINYEDSSDVFNKIITPLNVTYFYLCVFFACLSSCFNFNVCEFSKMKFKKL
jgi:hypothetical protein